MTVHYVNARADEPIVTIPADLLRTLLVGARVVAEVHSRGCQNSTTPWGCIDSRVAFSEFGFNQMCDPCTIHLLLAPKGHP